jgi:nucleotide-binding universal stress UspA family protein
MFSRMLVPLDGTPESNVALLPARAMAQLTGASIVLLHVLDRAWPELPGNEDELEAQARLEETHAELERVAEELRASGLTVESVPTRGHAADAILQHIRVERADLVIMRTHGRAGLERAALGSVTERVLKNSNIPVLLLRSGGRRVTTIRRLLVPVDGSPGGAVALATAVGLARTAAAQVHLLQDVVSSYAQVLAAYEGLAYYDPAWDDEALTSARTYVDGLVARLQASGVTASGEAHMVSDIPADIVAAAREKEIDIIVMSTHALTGLPRAIIGSVADAVTRGADCPVLLVHRPVSPQAVVADEFSAANVSG